MVITREEKEELEKTFADFTKIIIIRHGESLANAQRIYLGHTDWDLSDYGKQQAREVAQFLRDEKIDAIYSSDLIRAYNTALPNAEIHGLEIIKSQELREIYLGKWECMEISKIESEWSEEFIHGWRENFGIFCPPEGEAITALAERIYAEILRIGKLHRGGTVIVASHAAATRAFWGKVTGTPPIEVAEKIPFPHNASCTTVFCDGEKLIPGEYGIAHYLSPKNTSDA